MTIIRSIILHSTHVYAIGLYESAFCALCTGFFSGITIECFHSGTSLPFSIVIYITVKGIEYMIWANAEAFRMICCLDQVLTHVSIV